MSAGPSRVFAGKYEVERVLGRGGMGVVFAARHVRLGHRVAIKVLGEALRDHAELVARFEREARAAGALSSEHAVRVFDIDCTEDGTPFIVMERLDGCDLGELLEREGPQPVARAARWVIEACDAIAEAHRLGIIHRDLKPSNLFLANVDGRDVIKVLDFGVAKVASSASAELTTIVSPLGTPQYMSPEQVRCARDVDVRTDVWSLGVTVYELVTGRAPFGHEEPSACIASIAADPVPDPRELRSDLPDEFVEVLARALAKDPRSRYASVGELARALSPFGLLPAARRGAPVPASRRWSRKSVALFSAALLAAATVVAAPECVEREVGLPQPVALVPSTTVAAAPSIPVQPGPPEPPQHEPPPARALGAPSATIRAAAPVRPAPPAVRPAVRPHARASEPAVHGGLSGPGF